jgi:hypothetical protein
MSGMVAGQIPIAASATSVTSSIAPGHLPGTATNDSAAAGQVGEVISSVVTSGVAVATGATATVGSIALTAGDWDVMGEVWFAPGSTGVLSLIAALNGVASLPGSEFLTASLSNQTFAAASATYNQMAICPCRISTAGPQTMFLLASQTNGVGTTATGKIWARRAR